MRFVELFAGIGGFSLGFERAGMTCVGHVEINPYAQKVLLKHWPKVPLLPDVTKFQGDEFGEVDLLCGGFPCQDLSVAGKQKGIHGERSGLFDEIIRIARVCRPEFIVLENVANLLSRPEWFGHVLGRLAKIGYDAEWEIISAAGVGAPHLRKRIWIVAYTNTAGNRRAGQGANAEIKKGREPQPGFTGELAGGPEGLCPDVAYARCEHEQGNPEGMETRSTIGTASQLHAESSSKRFFSDTDQQGLEGQIPEGFGPRKSGLPTECSQWTVEPNVGRVANGVPSRMDRLKCLGNALVPQISEYIGLQILKAKGHY